MKQKYVSVSLNDFPRVIYENIKILTEYLFKKNLKEKVKQKNKIYNKKKKLFGFLLD